jgi:hypothetical protein
MDAACFVPSEVSRCSRSMLIRLCWSAYLAPLAIETTN